MQNSCDTIDDACREAFARQGAICLRGAFSDWIELLRADAARYVESPARTSPPFPGYDMTEGQKPRPGWFPLLWPQSPEP